MHLIVVSQFLIAQFYNLELVSVSPFALTILLIPVPPLQATIAFQVIEMILAIGTLQYRCIIKY